MYACPECGKSKLKKVVEVAEDSNALPGDYICMNEECPRFGSFFTVVELVPRLTIEPFEATDNDCVNLGPVLPEGTTVCRKVPSQHNEALYSIRTVDISGYPICKIGANCALTKNGARACRFYAVDKQPREQDSCLPDKV